MFGRNKTPSEKYIAADKKRQKLRDKRAKLDPCDPNFEKKNKKYMNGIHNESVKMEAAKMESKQPIKKTTNVNTSINASVNYNKTESGVHLHGHYHSSGKKKK